MSVCVFVCLCLPGMLCVCVSLAPFRRVNINIYSIVICFTIYRGPRGGSHTATREVSFLRPLFLLKHYAFFNYKNRVLRLYGDVAHCEHTHSPEQSDAALRSDTREAL